LIFILAKGISGIIPLATTGESPTIEEFEFEELLEKTVEVVNRRILSLWDTVEIIRKSA
jgi:4-hydroxy-tetrahydrodipicolinate synthase